MKTMTVYDSMLPALRVANDLFGRNDPFDFFERMFEDEPLSGLSNRMPVVDVREEEGRYLIEAELPGLSEKDVRLELKNGVLELATVKKEETEEKAKRWLRRERREFSFRRSFALPEDADSEKIEASFKNGLLKIDVPKKPEAAPRTVQVKIA